MSKSVLPMFSSKSFTVSGLTFRSLIRFEFIFVYGVRECSNFILLHVVVQFSQHHLLKRLSFLHCISNQASILTRAGVFRGHYSLELAFWDPQKSLRFVLCLSFLTRASLQWSLIFHIYSPQPKV